MVVFGVGVSVLAAGPALIRLYSDRGHLCAQTAKKINRLELRTGPRPKRADAPQPLVVRRKPGLALTITIASDSADPPLNPSTGIEPPSRALRRAGAGLGRSVRVPTLRLQPAARYSHDQSTYMIRCAAPQICFASGGLPGGELSRSRRGLRGELERLRGASEDDVFAGGVQCVDRRVGARVNAFWVDLNVHATATELHPKV
jgi:hypothetical protein